MVSLPVALGYMPLHDLLDAFYVLHFMHLHSSHTQIYSGSACCAF
jgi:hypothetical protein